VHKTRIAATQIELERSRGNYDNPYDRVSERLFGKPSGPSPAPALTRVGLTLGTLRDRFLADGEKNHGWGAKTRVNVQAVFGLLVEVFGEGMDIQAFTHQKLRDFRDGVLARMPPNRDKVARYRGKRYDAIGERQGLPVVAA